MGISLFNIAEQVKARMDRSSYQEVIRAVINNYAVFAKLSFYEGKAFENSPIDGSFFYTYSGIEVLKNSEGYYFIAPSTYLLLPHEFGIKSVRIDGCTDDFVQVYNYSMFEGLKAGKLGGRKVYEVNENKFQLPNITSNDLFQGVDAELKGMTIKIAVAMDDLDVDEPRNIAPNIVAQIVDAVVQQFAPKQQTAPDKVI